MSIFLTALDRYVVGLDQGIDDHLAREFLFIAFDRLTGEDRVRASDMLQETNIQTPYGVAA